MRYVIIDYMHLAHRCYNAQPLSATVKDNMTGQVVTVDTTIPNYTIKNIYRYGGKGEYYTAVCLEGGNNQRKAYFSNGSIDGSGYKGNRGSYRTPFYDGVNMTVSILLEGMVSCYRQEGLEADDMVYSLIQCIKRVDTKTPIDVITNDADLLPLVDDQVSVYMRGNREYSEQGCPTHRLYYQVTPESWEEYLSYTSAYRDFYIPYNSMLLFKMIRGDKSDNIAPAIKGYGGKKYSELMDRMVEDGVDFPNIFRYGNDFDTVMAPVLARYFKPDEIARMKYIYTGICLRAVNVMAPKQIEQGLLQLALSKYKIHLS